jgi:hypothetical protein
VHRPHPQFPHPDHFVRVEQLVVSREHVGILGLDRHSVTRFAHCRHGLDVVLVAVGLHDALDPEPFTELEQHPGFVGGIDHQRRAATPAAHHENVVVHGPHDHFGDLGAPILVVHFFCLIGHEALRLQETVTCE